MASETCEITELLRILNKRNQLLVKVWLYFTLGLGIVLSLFGLIAWPFLASTLGPLTRLMFPPVILCAALVLPLLFQWIFRLALPVPRCPECGARMESLSPALRRCPKCCRVVARDSRSLLPGYQLPTDEKSLRVRDPEEAISVGTVAVRVGSFLLCAIPIVWVGSFYFGSSFPETGSVEAGTWMITAGGVLVFALYFAAVAFQRAAPKLVEWIAVGNPITRWRRSRGTVRTAAVRSGKPRLNRNSQNSWRKNSSTVTPRSGGSIMFFIYYFRRLSCLPGSALKKRIGIGRRHGGSVRLLLAQATLSRCLHCAGGGVS